MTEYNPTRSAKTTQKRVAAVATVVGLLVLGLSAPPIVRHFFMVDVVPNVILVEEPRETSYWQLTETPKGFLIQAKTGRYQGWYFDADETMGQEFMGAGLELAANRFLILSRQLRESCYWQFDKRSDGTYVYASTGPFRGLYLDIAAGDEATERDGVRFTKNLLIGRVEYPWRLAPTERGHLIWAGSRRAVLDYGATVDSESIWKRSAEDRRRDLENTVSGQGGFHWIEADGRL